MQEATHMKSTFALLIGSALLIGAPAFAKDGVKDAEGHRKDPQAFFNRIDTDHDGKVSLAEFQAAPMRHRKHHKEGEQAASGENVEAKQLREERFKKLDTNNDGSITADEFAAARSKFREKKQAQ